MLIFIGGAGSRLGNQIFQYVFLKSLAKDNEIINVSGFEHLLEIFEIEGITNISQRNRLVKAFILRIIWPIAKFVGKIRLISVIKVDVEYINGFRRESNTYSVKEGLIKFIKYIEYGFFQSESFFKKEVASSLKLKPEFYKKADEFLKDIPINMHKIFVHIRRGDYNHVKILDKSALLPMEYYKNQINYFLKNYANCYFIFLSDEPDFIEEEFKYITDKKISRKNHSGTDFAIITRCRSGILSMSTFGWWAGYMINEKGIIFAPKYWLGFNSKIEFPVSGFPGYATAVEIEQF